MSFRELAKPLQGIIPPVATPLAETNRLDLPGLERLIEHLVEGGVHGLFLLGTCGEGPSLAPTLRRQLVEHVCEQVGGRIPVLVSITDTSLTSAVEFTNLAAEAGADAVVLAPPFYYQVEQNELAQFVLRIVRDVELPLVLYNMPGLTKVTFEPQTVRRLLDEEQIVALKDSSGNLVYFEQVRQLANERPGWNILIGPEHLLATSLAMGADGGVPGGANICPQLFVQLYNAATANDQEQTTQLSATVDQLGKIYEVDQPSFGASSVIKALKAALSHVGICEDRVAQPLDCLSSDEKDQIKRILQEIDWEQLDAASARLTAL